MADSKPPRLAGDERQTLLALLQYVRDSFAQKLTAVDEDRAASPMVMSGTSLLWLANHMADAETTWVLNRFARAQVQRPAAGTVADAIARYRATWDEVDAVIDGADLDDPCPVFDDQPAVNLRWIVGHLLEEAARHAGHADILRELIDGHTGR